MSTFSETQLKDAGWQPGRRVPIDESLAALRMEGYKIWPELEAFLHEFLGLTIAPSSDDDHPNALVFDTVKAIADVDKGWPAGYARILHCELSPIGEYSHMTIYLGSDHKFYGGYDADFGAIGEDVHEVIDNILNDSAPKEKPLLNQLLPDDNGNLPQVERPNQKVSE